MPKLIINGNACSGVRNRSRRQLVAVDLFCGAGGLTEGLRQAGFKVAAALELDPVAVETYRLNHPEVKVVETDIRLITAPEFCRRARLRRRVDVLIGCPPCQGFSTLRTRNQASATRDNRNDLVLALLKFVAHLKPTVVVLENVPALARNNRLRVLRRQLERRGYSTRVEIADAADFGVPQRRRRLFMLATKSKEPLKLPDVRPRSSMRSVRRALQGLRPAGKSGDPLHDHGEHRSESIRDLIRRIPKNGGSRAALPAEMVLRCHRAFDGFSDVFGRIAWDGVGPTITSGCHNPSKGRFIHPTRNRAITLREAALLQTFPKTYVFSLRRGKEHTAALIGNAVPPEWMRRISSQIAKHLKR